MKDVKIYVVSLSIKGTQEEVDAVLDAIARMRKRYPAIDGQTTDNETLYIEDAFRT